MSDDRSQTGPEKPDRNEELEQLAGELSRAAAAGDEAAMEALSHVERYMEQPTEEEGESLGNRLSEALRHWEAEHPNLAATVQTVIHSLTGSGI